MIRPLAALTAAVVVGLGALGTAIQATVSAGSAGFVTPVAGAWISQAFGCTPFTGEPSDPRCPSGHWHSGIDLAVGAGTPVLATLAGVATVIHERGGFGLHIVIDHGQGLSSLYGHLQSVAISTGQDVVGGQLIGAVGSTGNSTGPHLHFEIRRDGIPEDPQIDLHLP